MKNFLKKSFALLILSVGFFQAIPAYAVHVNGYYRANGTYVNSYERTAPDGNPYNNYSYPGNYNPNTGSITGGDPQTYLNNYYDNSSSYSGSYSYPTIPTCPLNSYYDGISSCKCNYGYAVSGSSCVSQDSLCWEQTGYSSSYDTLTDTCKCNYGYIIGSSGTCVNANSYCEDKIGLMSEYDNSSKQCQCMVGYEFDGSTCVSKNYSNTYPTAYYNNPSTCPLNSHVSTSDTTKCSCDAGYQVNSTGDSCVIQVTKTNSQVCQDGYGFNVDWDGTYDTSNGQLNCNCKSGYVWNSARTACISAPVIENPVTPVINNNPVIENIPTVESETTVIDKPLIVKKTDVFKKILIATSTASSTASSTKPDEGKSSWWGAFLGWIGFK